MEGREVALKGDKELALYELETRFAVAVKQRELLENYIKERLHPGKHFYTVSDEPKQKPSLTKEGAELICLPHNLKGHYDWLAGLENPSIDDSPYQITMKCILERNGIFEGEGIGSASSMITKKDGTRIQRQKDPGLRHNATIKMACKSAYIAATLNSTAASEFFTQDLEDDQDREFSKKKLEEHWCSIHNVPFKKITKGKQTWWSHKTDDGWCNEKPAKDKEVSEEKITNSTEAIEPQTESHIFIDLEWLKESVRELGRGATTAIVFWIGEQFKTNTAGKFPDDIVGRLTREQQEALSEEIQNRLNMK